MTDDRDPWITPSGEVVHPQAPAGSGGPGNFRQAHPHGLRHARPAAPHPRSPASRQFVLDHKKKKAIKRNARQKDHPKPVQQWKDDDALNAKVKAEADGYVGKPVVGDGECYALADATLNDASAKSAPDFTEKITDDGDYKWGRPLADMKEVKAGDILQFRNHQFKIHKVTKVKRTEPNGSWKVETKKEDEEHHRGHHTAVVSEVNADGTLTVVEQHVKDPSTGQLSKVVRRNTLYLSSSNKKFPKKVTREFGGAQVEEETTITITVTGKIWPYRPQAK